MKIQNLFDKAKVNNWPYFFMATKNSHSSHIYEKDNSIIYCLNKIAFSYCEASYHQLKIILAFNNSYFIPEELYKHFNEVLARSFSKAYCIPLIMGIGNNKPSVYKLNKDIALKSNHINNIFDSLLGTGINNSLITLNYHIFEKNEIVYASKKQLYNNLKSYGVDIIPLLVAESSFKSKKKFPWIEILKNKIMNLHARKFLMSYS